MIPGVDGEYGAVRCLLREEESLVSGTGSREMYYKDENGVHQDAALHGPILAEGDEQSVIAATRARLIARGEDPVHIARLYPDPVETAPAA